MCVSCRMTDPDFLTVEPNEDSSEKLARFWNCDIIERSCFQRGVQEDGDEEEVTLVETFAEEKEREDR